MKLLSLLVLGTFAAFANAAAVDNTLVGRDCGGRKLYHLGTVHYTFMHETNFSFTNIKIQREIHARRIRTAVRARHAPGNLLATPTSSAVGKSCHDLLRYQNSFWT